MPYASLQEAYKTYDELIGGGDTTEGTSNDDLLASELDFDYVEKPFHPSIHNISDDSPELAANYEGRLSRNHHKHYRRQHGSGQYGGASTSTGLHLGVNQVSGIQTNVIEDTSQKDAIAKTEQRDIDISWRVPKNQSLVQSPDDGVKSFANTPSVLPPYLIEGKKFKFTRYNQGGGADTGIVPGDCSDDTCMSLINHILDCDACAAKLNRLMNLGEGSGSSSNVLGFNFTNLNMSKVMFYIIVVILVIAVYELLNNIFRRIRG
jgi:hypothetical protein